MRIIPQLGKPAEIPFRSDQKTLITYVDDAAEIFARFCFAENLNFPVYNSCAYSVTLQQLAETVKKFLPEAKIGFNEKAPDQPLIYNWSSERLEKELDFKLPPLEEMVRKHINEVRSAAGLTII